MEDNQFLLIYNSPDGVIFHLIENALVMNNKWTYNSQTKSALFTLSFEKIHQTEKEVLPMMIADIVRLLEYKMSKMKEAVK
jgi:hypothetical protein